MKYLVIGFLSLLACGCTQSSNKTKLAGPSAHIGLQSKDTTKYTILTFDTSLRFRCLRLLNKTCKAAAISVDEIEEIKVLIKAKVTDYNKTAPLNPNPRVDTKVKDLSNYYTQLVPVINSKGEKEVLVNCFCNEFLSFSKQQLKEDWRKNVLIGEDGGNCFFHAYVNFTTNSVRSFKVNDSE